MKLKVCGLSNPVEVETCVEYGVNYCGFILNYTKSHRYVPFDQADRLTNINKKKSKYVGVLVKPSHQELERYSKLNLDYFQLYGDYNNDQLQNISKKFKLKIISAIQVKKKEDVEGYKKIEAGSDIILWDSSGYEESLNWNFKWIDKISTNKEKMVAGNITLDKLENLTDLTDGVDVSGALETNKVKDVNKIKEFINQIRTL